MAQAILNNQAITPDEQLMSLALYGFACFTSFYVQKGMIKGLSLHLQRLENDANELFGTAPERETILQNIHRFIEQSPKTDNIAIRITIFPCDFSIARPKEMTKLNILVSGRSAPQADTAPLKLASIDALRSCPLQKTGNMVSPLKARAAAQAKDFDDAIMIDNGIITEGPTWNIFFGVDNQLFTPALECGILPGVTRKLIIDGAYVAGFEINEDKIDTSKLSSFDYCFVSNALIGVKPVACIDEHTYNINSPWISALQHAYQTTPSVTMLQPKQV